MRFKMTEDGALRLGLDPNRVCFLPGQTGPDGAPVVREFSGPSVREGLLGGFPRGVIAWLKKELKVTHVSQLDIIDSRLAYYVIAMRSTDHSLLPISRFADLALTDFELIRHVVTIFDQDGDCGECNMTLDNPVHIPAEPGADEVPPTTGPAGPETNATATG